MGVRKFQLVVDDESMAVLQHLKKEGGHATISETIRRAIGLYDWAMEQEQAGLAVGAVSADGARIRELVLTTRKRRGARTGG